uniref:Secreted protein n=1 Tax=Meloidogyne hapla TaxID=6305 RepID=A0A1I8B940_MELHA
MLLAIITMRNLTSFKKTHGEHLPCRTGPERCRRCINHVEHVQHDDSLPSTSPEMSNTVSPLHLPCPKGRRNPSASHTRRT